MSRVKIVDNPSEYFICHFLRMTYYGKTDVYEYQWIPFDIIEGFPDAITRCSESFEAYKITEFKTGNIRTEFISENIKDTVDPPQKKLYTLNKRI